MGHPMLGNLELHRTHRCQDRGLVASQIRAQHLHDTLVIELFDPAPELLVSAGVLGPGHREVLGRERRDRGEGHRFVDEEGVTHPQCVGVYQADHVAREGSVDARALAAHDLLGVLRGERAVGTRVGDDHASFEGSRADPHKSEAVAVRDIHPSLHLEDEGAERRVDLTQHSFGIGPGAGGRGKVDQGVEQEPDAEVEDGRPEHHRSARCRQESLRIVSCAGSHNQVALLNSLQPRLTLESFGLLGAEVFLGRHGCPAIGAGEF